MWLGHAQQQVLTVGDRCRLLTCINMMLQWCIMRYSSFNLPHPAWNALVYVVLSSLALGILFSAASEKYLHCLKLIFADQFSAPERAIDKPLRMCVSDVFKGHGCGLLSVWYRCVRQYAARTEITSHATGGVGHRERWVPSKLQANNRTAA